MIEPVQAWCIVTPGGKLLPETAHYLRSYAVELAHGHFDDAMSWDKARRLGWRVVKVTIAAADVALSGERREQT